MPFETKLDEVPAAYTMKGTRQDELVHVIVREFTSSEDGDFFISRLEGLPSILIEFLPREIRVRWYRDPA